MVRPLAPLDDEEPHVTARISLTVCLAACLFVPPRLSAQDWVPPGGPPQGLSPQAPGMILPQFGGALPTNPMPGGPAPYAGAYAPPLGGDAAGYAAQNHPGIYQTQPMPWEREGHSPLREFITRVVPNTWVRFEYLSWDVDDIGAGLVGAPTALTPDPRFSPIPIGTFDVDTFTAQNHLIPTTEPISFNKTSGGRITWGIPLRFGSLEFSGFALEENEDSILSNIPGQQGVVNFTVPNTLPTGALSVPGSVATVTFPFGTLPIPFGNIFPTQIQPGPPTQFTTVLSTGNVFTPFQIGVPFIIFNTAPNTATVQQTVLPQVNPVIVQNTNIPQLPPQLISTLISFEFDLILPGNVIQIPVSTGVGIPLLQNNGQGLAALLYDVSYNAQYRSEVWGSEAKLVMDVGPDHGGMTLNPLVGFRYLSFDEQFKQVGVTTFSSNIIRSGQTLFTSTTNPQGLPGAVRGPARASIIDSEVENSLYGLQVGTRAEFNHKWFTLGAEPRISLGANSYEATVTTTNLRSAADGVHRTTFKDTTFAPVFEAGLYGKVHLTQYFSLYASYDYSYLFRVSRPADNIYYNDDGPNSLPGVVVDANTQDTHIQGLTIGGEIRFR